MNKKFSFALDKISEFFARRKGLLPLLGLLLVILNIFFQLVPVGWSTQTSFFLNLGIVVAIIGFLLAWAL
jgi:hypothetical protein